jgi:hypothetical protein
MRLNAPVTNNTGLESIDGYHAGAPWVFVAFAPCTVTLVPFRLALAFSETSDKFFNTLPIICSALDASGLSQLPKVMQESAKSHALQPGDAVIFPPGAPISFNKGRILGKFVTVVGILNTVLQEFRQEVQQMAKVGAPFNAELTATMETFRCATLPMPKLVAEEEEEEEEKEQHPLFAKYNEAVQPILTHSTVDEEGKMWYQGK